MFFIVTEFLFFFIVQIDDYALVKFLPLYINDEDSMNAVLANIDSAIQYGEDMEPREPKVNSDFRLYQLIQQAKNINLTFAFIKLLLLESGIKRSMICYVTG
jgi:hypothetical protein